MGTATIQSNNILGVKRELNSYKYYRIRINKLKNKIESLDNALICPTSSILIPPTNENTGTKENKFITLMDLKKDYETLVIEAEKVCLELDSKINKVKNHVARCVLYLKYCELKTIEEIGYIIHYSKGQVKRFLAQGVEEYSKISKKLKNEPK